MELALDRVLAFGLRPTDVDAVDSDSVPAVREGSVTGKTRQTGLCCGVRAEVWLTAMLAHRNDVDDRARLSSSYHVRDGGLHREERRWQVDRHVLFEESSTDVSSSELRVVSPAELTRQSTRPNRSTV